MKTSRLFHISARHAHVTILRDVTDLKKRDEMKGTKEKAVKEKTLVRCVQAMDRCWVVHQDVLRALLDVLEIMRCYI